MDSEVKIKRGKIVKNVNGNIFIQGLESNFDSTTVIPPLNVRGNLDNVSAPSNVGCNFDNVDTTASYTGADGFINCMIF